MTILELIKENPGINLTIDANTLKQFAKDIVEQTTTAVLEQYQEKTFTPDEIIQRFNICRTTLWKWEKLGLIKGKKIGGRKYYTESEVKKAIESK